MEPGGAGGYEWQGCLQSPSLSSSVMKTGLEPKSHGEKVVWDCGRQTGQSIPLLLQEPALPLQLLHASCLDFSLGLGIRTRGCDVAQNPDRGNRSRTLGA